MSIDSKLKDLDIEFLPYVPVKLPASAIEAIKQIFVDEGWVQVPQVSISKDSEPFSTSHKGGYIKIHPEGVYMTGEYWYAKFEKELKKQYDSFVEFADIDMNIYNHGKEAMMLASLEAAHRASGVSDDH